MADYGTKKNCCYQCEKRHVGCHAKCPEYQDFYKKNQERNETIRKQKEASWRQECGSALAKSELTKQLEQQIWSATICQGTFGCLEVTIGWFGKERVDYLTYDTKGCSGAMKSK